MMFSSPIDMIYKNFLAGHIRKITVYQVRKYALYEKVMSGYISTNTGIHHQFRIYYKVGKASQRWVSSCSAQIQ